MVAPLAILDSDVLFGVISMDVLMSLGVAAIYEPHWSEEILFAAERNILKVRPNVEPSRLRSRFEDMDDALPDALVEVPAGLAHSMPNDPGDRHVLAAAVAVGAQYIVTNNVRHFLPEHCEPFGISAIRADAFVAFLVRLDAEGVRDALVEMALRKRRPSMPIPAAIVEVRSVFPDAIATLEGLVGEAETWTITG